MYTLVAFTVIVVLLYLVAFFHKVDNTNWMDMRFTTQVKGMAILMVVWSHSSGINNLNFVAGTGVSLFLICSGYGLEMSCSVHGLKNYWKKRLQKVALPYWIIVVVQLLVSQNSDFRIWFEELFFIHPLNWFLRYIFVCYVLYWIYRMLTERFMLPMKKQWTLIGILWVIKFLSEIICPVNPMVPFLEARQLFSFVFGVWLAQNSGIIQRFWNKKHSGLFQIALLIIAFSINILLHQSYAYSWNTLVYNMLSTLTVFPLALVVMNILYHFSALINNCLLEFVGDISYEMFLLHGYLLRILKGDLISTIIFVVVVILSAKLYHIFIDKICGMIKKSE